MIVEWENLLQTNYLSTDQVNYQVANKIFEERQDRVNEEKVERRKGEEKMLESKKNIKLEEILLREEWDRVTPRDINLKEKENKHECAISSCIARLSYLSDHIICCVFYQSSYLQKCPPMCS